MSQGIASTVIVKTLTSGHVAAPNYEGESMPIRDQDGHRAMQAAGKASHELGEHLLEAGS